MTLVPLSNSDKMAEVDAEDYARLSAHSWGLYTPRTDPRLSRRAGWVARWDKETRRRVFLHREVLRLKSASQFGEKPLAYRIFDAGVRFLDNNPLNCRKSNLRPRQRNTIYLRVVSFPSIFLDTRTGKFAFKAWSDTVPSHYVIQGAGFSTPQDALAAAAEYHAAAERKALRRIEVLENEIAPLIAAEAQRARGVSGLPVDAVRFRRMEARRKALEEEVSRLRRVGNSPAHFSPISQKYLTDQKAGHDKIQDALEDLL